MKCFDSLKWIEWWKANYELNFGVFREKNIETKNFNLHFHQIEYTFMHLETTFDFKIQLDWLMDGTIRFFRFLHKSTCNEQIIIHLNAWWDPINCFDELKVLSVIYGKYLMYRKPFRFHWIIWIRRQSRSYRNEPTNSKYNQKKEKKLRAIVLRWKKGKERSSIFLFGWR